MSERTDTHTVEFSKPRERLDQYLTGVYQAVSRATILRLIKDGHITVNGKTFKPTRSPREGDEIAVIWPDVRPAIPEPEDIPLDVLFEDKDLLVINKPPGLCVHPGNGHETGTMVHALLHHCKGELSGIGGVARPGIVHRLDLDTSGCIVVAKNDTAHIELCRQFADRETKKVYHAIVCGQLTRMAGEIRVAIARHSTHRKRMAALDDGDGKSAHTSYRRIRHLNHASLAEATIHTGRTHQIRVHFQYLGHPLLGDALYGRNRNTALKDQTGFEAPRQMLHSARLGFTHPTSGEFVECEAPWPDDFKASLAALELTETLQA
jgi:23S rRNA pseudouridine1911/1915/1917 synthase